jgi:hypothetical protein
MNSLTNALKASEVGSSQQVMYASRWKVFPGYENFLLCSLHSSKQGWLQNFSIKYETSYPGTKRFYTGTTKLDARVQIS